MNVPMLDMAAHQAPFAADLKAALAEVVDSGWYILGPKVTELEERVAAYVGSDHAIGVSSGTDALLVALMALGVGAGDSVLTTPYSFFATAGVISRLGARPVFVDVDADTGNIDAALARAYLQQHGVEKIKAILPVHLFGQTADMQALVAIAAEYGVPVVEDAAQAIGARAVLSSGSARAGSMGLLGCFSFFPSKNLGGVGDGGMVVTSDRALAERVRSLSRHGEAPKYHHAQIGGNFRLDALQAAALLVKLPYLDRWHAGRQAHAARYDDAFAEHPGIRPLKRAVPRDHHVYNQYVVRIAGDRDAVAKHLGDKGIATAQYYPVPFHLQGCFADLGYAVGAFPVSERLAAQTLALPVFAELTEAQQDDVIEAVLAAV